MCLEQSPINISRHHLFQHAKIYDFCTSHDPPCELYKARIPKQQTLGVPVSLICVHFSYLGTKINFDV